MTKNNLRTVPQIARIEFAGNVHHDPSRGSRFLRDETTVRRPLPGDHLKGLTDWKEGMQMADIIIETLRAIVVGGALLILLRARHAKGVAGIEGWWYLVTGFLLVFFGTAIDITDNFKELNRFVIVGDTEVEAFLEKVVGYLLGFMFLAFGIWRWLPRLAEYAELSRKEIVVQKERLRVLRATMRTVNDIVNNFLQNMQLFKLETEEKNALEPESLALMDSIIQETAAKLKKLGDLDSTPEMKMAGGIGIDYEGSPSLQDPAPH